jgi:hypothetical protein
MGADKLEKGEPSTRLEGDHGLLCRPMLEIAYWIGAEPGVDDPRTELMEQYRDRRQHDRNTPGMQDRFVTFHFHFDSARDLFVEHDGHTFTGFVSRPSFTFFPL